MNTISNYKDIIINFLITFLFGVRVEGEPIDLSHPEPAGELPPVDAAFFEWCKELNVGCQAKSNPIFY